MEALVGGEPGGSPAGRPEGEPPLVVALPAEEALHLLRQAGWTAVRTALTRAPRGAAPGDGEAGERFVVRQRWEEGVVHLTLAAHPGGPWAPGEVRPAAGAGGRRAVGRDASAEEGQPHG